MDTTTLQWYEIIARLGVAAALGAVVGVERGSSGHEAGLRTHVLVSVGSALFAVASVGAFDEFIGLRADTNVNIDVTRMAAYVAPGIGFIGAGVIVKNKRADTHPMVMGLTTAASLWTVAAIGVAAGLGFWVGAVAAAGAALVALVLARPVSDWLERRSPPPPTRYVVEASYDHGADVAPVLAAVGRHAEIVSTTTVHRDGAHSIELEIVASSAAVAALTAALAERSELRRVHIATPSGS